MLNFAPYYCRRKIFLVWTVAVRIRREMKLEDEIDDLFRLPLAEFTSSRNALAARLKKDGRANDADRVKLLTKPSISAWAVNQLYWEYREEFDALIATGKRFRAAQASRPAGKAANIRDSLDARREALVNLSDLASELLSEAGHSPTLDTLHRVTTTLEAMSTYALLGDGPAAGRLTNDVDPPSFESLASLMSGGVGFGSAGASSSTPARKPAGAEPSARQKASAREEARKLRQARIAAAKVSLQEAKKSLVEARAEVQSLEGAQKKANAEAKEAEKYRRDAEELLKKATAASDAAARRALNVTSDIEAAEQAVEDAKRTIAAATKELESLLRESV